VIARPFHPAEDEQAANGEYLMVEVGSVGTAWKKEG